MLSQHIPTHKHTQHVNTSRTYHLSGMPSMNTILCTNTHKQKAAFQTFLVFRLASWPPISILRKIWNLTSSVTGLYHLPPATCISINIAQCRTTTLHYWCFDQNLFISFKLRYCNSDIPKLFSLSNALSTIFRIASTKWSLVASITVAVRPTHQPTSCVCVCMCVCVCVRVCTYRMSYCVPMGTQVNCLHVQC